MSKAEDIARVSAKGSFHLLWGLVVSTVISSVGAIFIARFLGSDLYGLYTIVIVVPTFIQIFRDWGVNAAMVKFTAQFRAEGRLDEIRSVFLTGVIFEVVAGLLLSLFAFFFSEPLAVLFNRPVIASLIQIVSFSILANGLIVAATSAFTGIERMELNSVMLIVQSILKTAIIISLVVLGFGAAGASVGYSSGALIAGTIGLALIWVIYRRLPKPATNKLEIRAYLNTMLTYSLPLSFAIIIFAVLPQFYAFVLPIHYANNNIPIGNYGVAINFVVLIAFFAVPITTMLFPAFSKLDAAKDTESLKNIFRFSVKYAALLVVPVAVLVMSLAGPAVYTLFGDTYGLAPLFLSLLAIQYIYTAAGNLSLTGLLHGQGKTGFFLKMAILSGFIGFPLGYFAIMAFGVLGLIGATLVANVPGIIWGLHYVNKVFGVSVDWGSSVRILISSGIAGFVTYSVISLLSLSSWLELVLGVLVFVVVLVPSLLLTRSISLGDLGNLRSMTEGLGAVGGLLGWVLDLLEKLMGLLKL